jgi:hypothetical protein
VNDELLSESSWDPNDDELAYLEIPHIQPEPVILTPRSPVKRNEHTLSPTYISAAKR